MKNCGISLPPIPNFRQPLKNNMRAIILAQLFVFVAMLWYCGYLKSTVDAELSKSTALRESNDDIKNALRNAAYTHKWNYQALKEIFMSDMAIESQERRLKMAAIINIYQMNGEYKRLGIDSPYAETFLYDLRVKELRHPFSA